MSWVGGLGSGMQTFQCALSAHLSASLHIKTGYVAGGTCPIHRCTGQTKLVNLFLRLLEHCNAVKISSFRADL